MSAPRKLQGYRYLPVCLLLLSACALAETRDVRMHGPNGDSGACTEAGVDADADSATPRATSATAKPTAVSKPAAARIKPVVTVRGGSDDNSAHAARWHSFLPGMFR
jgi:hypothetical protein